MKIFPAIDLSEGCAVRLLKGDYAQKTVYSDDPVSVAKGFRDAGGEILHLVDLDGAKSGKADNFETIKSIVESTDLSVEVGGGIRNMETLDKYMAAGVGRAILGTAAVTDEEFLVAAVEKYGEKIAVGADIKDGFVAISGWTEKSEYTVDSFFLKMQELGVSTIICTDISRDGAMRGTNLDLYRALSEKYSMQVIASGGVTSLDDVRALAEMNLYGAIIGKAYYTGAIDLDLAIRIAKNDN